VQVGEHEQLHISYHSLSNSHVLPLAYPCRPAARPSSSLLSKLNRVQQGGYADSASRYTGYSRLK